MKFSNEMPVKSAMVHQAVTVVGTKLGSLTTLTQDKVPGLVMTWTPQGLVLKVPPSAKAEKHIYAVVPQANVAVVIFEQEPDEVKKK